MTKIKLVNAKKVICSVLVFLFIATALNISNAQDIKFGIKGGLNSWQELNFEYGIMNLIIGCYLYPFLNIALSAKEKMNTNTITTSMISPVS